MAKKITIFSLIMLIMLLAFSFITLRIVRLYDISSVGTKGFSRPTDTQIYNSTIEKVRTTKGYKNDIIPSYPLVISALSDSYTHFVAPVEDIVLVSPPEETPSAVISVPKAPSTPAVTVILPDRPAEAETPSEVTPPSEPVYVREALSTQKAEMRLEDILDTYKTAVSPGKVVSSLDTDTSNATLTEKDRAIARKAMRDAALEKIMPVLNSDAAKNFVWYDPYAAPDNIAEDMGIY